MSIHISKLLIRENILSMDQVGKVLEKQEDSGCTFITSLLSLKYVDEITLMVLLSQEFSIPYLNNDEINCDDSIVELVPIKIALENQLIPFMKSDSDLFVAITDPSDLYLHDYLSFITGYNIKFLLTKESTILKAIDKYYKKNENKIEKNNKLNYQRTNSNLNSSELSIENIISELNQYRNSINNTEFPIEEDIGNENALSIDENNIEAFEDEAPEQKLPEELEAEGVDYLSGFRSAVSASTSGISSPTPANKKTYQPFNPISSGQGFQKDGFIDDFNTNSNHKHENLKTDFTPDIFTEESDPDEIDEEFTDQIFSSDQYEEIDAIDIDQSNRFYDPEIIKEKDEEILTEDNNDFQAGLNNREELTELLTELPQQPEHQAESETSKRVVLVVDDSPTILRLVTMILEKSGYEVVTALSGLEALARAKEKNPDLMLLDINLPHLDGYQICKIIKNNRQTSNIPVVMLSGRDGFFDRMKGKMAGAKHYITKPFDSTTLITATEKYINKKNS